MSDDARMAPVYILGFVLIVLLLVANVVVAADRTALDSEHTIETFGEENVYEDVAAIAQADTVERVNETIEEQKEQRIEEQIESRGLSERQEAFARQQINEELPNRTQQEAFVEGAITSGFIERELTRNLETIYAVLHGEQSDGQITVRISEQKDQLNESIRETLRDDPRIDEEEIIATVSGEVPDEENITEGGAVPSEVEGASAGVGLVGTLSWLLPLGALGLLAGMFHFTGRDLRRTARSGGTGFAIAGVLGAAIGFGLGAVATGAVESAVDADSEAVAAMSDGIVAVVDSLFGTIVTQGLLIAAVGLVAIGTVVAEQRGYLDDLLGDDRPPQQGQHQQEQYQQGQHQQEQYQQGQQGQSQQQGGQQFQHGQPQENQQYQQSQQYEQGQYDQQGQYQDGQQYNQGQHQDGQGQYDQQGQYQDGQQEQYQGQQGQYDEQEQYQGGQYDHQEGQQYEQYQDGQSESGQEPAGREQYDEESQSEAVADSDEPGDDGQRQD